MRPVQEYRETSYGLYMSRTDHAKFNHMQTWLLLRWDCAPASFTSPRDTGRAASLYRCRPVPRSRRRRSLACHRLVSGPGRRAAAAARADRRRQSCSTPVRPACSSTADAQEAVFVATRALVGAADHDHRVQDWLDAQVGDPLTWLDFER